MTDDRVGATRVVGGCLMGLAASLMTIGFVSETPVRHLVQVVPVVVAFIVTVRSRSVGGYLAAAVFVFWMGIMVLIWLYLLGLSDIASGSYTATEITLTILVAGCSAFGFAYGIRVGRTMPWKARVIVFASGFGFQYLFLWLSFLRPFVER